MRQQLIKTIKRHPLIYRAVTAVISAFQTPLQRWRGTKSKGRWWAGRSIAEGYWGNQNHPSKQFLAERISAFSPIGSILEVGCASGPNLYVLSKKFPQAQFSGIDINLEAVEYGNRKFAEENIRNVKLLAGKADELGQFQDGSFDIVFTNALLCIIGPDKIRQVVKDMLRISRRALILMELHRFDSHRKNNSGLGTYRGGNWVRDYAALLRQFVPEDQIQIVKIPEEVWPVLPWKESGAVIEVVIKEGK